MLKKEDEMIKKFIILTALLTFVLTPVWAARSMTKDYKISVWLPATISLSDQNMSEESERNAQVMPRRTTEKMVIADNNEIVLLRTTVAD